MTRDRKQQLRASYDQEVNRYIANSTMQAENLRKLLLLISNAKNPDARVLRILDVGCGTGTAIDPLRVYGWLKDGAYLGLDLSPKMIEAARSRYQSDGIRFDVADAEHLPVTDQSFDVVLSNSVLHWLNQPGQGSTPARAIQEFARAAAAGGLIGSSIAGQGTGRRFLQYYHRLMETYRDKSDFVLENYVDDPVGSMTLDDVVDLFHEAKLEILVARLDYEPVAFASSSRYVDAIRAYGYETFMAPLPEHEKMIAWNKLEESFVRDFPSQPYRHDQYMIYILARRPA